MVISSYNTCSILSLSGLWTSSLCHTTEKTHISYNFLAKQTFRIYKLYNSLKATFIQKQKLLPFFLHKLDSLANRLKTEELQLSQEDRNKKDNRFINETLTNNMDKNNDILDIDSWFDDELQWSSSLSHA